MGWFASGGCLQALSKSYDRPIGHFSGEPFFVVALHLIFCVVYGAAYGAALTGKIACINRNSAITALVFAVVLWLLNKPFG